MKASELRIGNLVLRSDINEVCSVFSILNEYQIKTEESIPESHISYYEGIKLTEDWLMRLGLEKGIDWNKKPKFTNKSFHVGLDERTGKYFVMLFVGAVDVEFVHQLQNLYFAITGEELEF